MFISGCTDLGREEGKLSCEHSGRGPGQLRLQALHLAVHHFEYLPIANISDHGRKQRLPSRRVNEPKTVYKET